MNGILVLVVAIATVSVSVSGQGYELDPNKLRERQDLIMGIVARGIPYGTHSAYKPRIGSAYSAYPSAGYNTAKVGYNAPAAAYNTGYNVRATGYNNPYTPNRGYGYTAPAANVYPSSAAGLGVGYNPGYGAAATGYNPSYGAAATGYNPSYGASGYKFGGGRVHPIFNNDLLYKPKATNTDLGAFGNKDPIFIGGGVASASSIPKVAATLPQIDAYGNPRTGSAKSLTGKDTIQATLTGQAGSLYQNLPGYTNPLFNKP